MLVDSRESGGVVEDMNIKRSNKVQTLDPREQARGETSTGNEGVATHESVVSAQPRT